ncbi:flagellar export chaperone FliS [Lawsonia intracellularis]|nr:flagellar export chaperone FliS [Lawsonia intracellularis]OMQ05950.1 flagellar export chaperone FliS [Lawsonia intracellularis]UYH53131.1 flagellar export chaperone FliS [Lawsonia intracellularis]
MIKGTQAYVEAQFNTTGQGEVLLLLYDGAIKFLNQAKEKILEKDFGAKGILISKALDVISELESSLNMNLGGEIAENLHNLYVLCTTRLLQANLKLDIKLIDSVIDVLAGLRSAYAEILNTPEAKAAAAEIASKLSVSQQSSGSPVPITRTQHPTGASKSLAQSAYKTQQITGTQAQVAAQHKAQEELNKQKELTIPSPSTTGLASRRVTSTYGKISQNN